MPYPLTGSAQSGAVKIAPAPVVRTSPSFTRATAPYPPPWQASPRSATVHIAFPARERQASFAMTRVWGGQMSSGTIIVTQSTLNIHVDSGVVEYSAPQPPLLFAATGKDITVDIGPTRTSCDVAAARYRAQADVGVTRVGSADIAPSTTKWAVDPNTRDRAQLSVGDTRYSTLIGDTRVQRNRS
jgi:hypothetical protein